MLAFFSVADASIIVALITGFTTLYAVRRNGKEIKQINNAVNHVGPNEPTLIQRVKNVEHRQDTHAEWERVVFSAIASQLGITLPKHPGDE